MNSFDEVFAQVKSYITEHELISDVARDTWIETMSPVELDGQDAVFEVDTGFQQGIIQNNYKKMLEEVLEKVMGFPVNLVVHVVVP
ncbi:MAG: chromosomal replication initiator protein DnaA, partial [Oscillospiraceae bacterium]|nr:chromosomal replication initiator protein DnaA [Oscillospiraceae bacterium]